MIEIKGFKILNEIYNGNNTIIYKAINEINNKTVAIKLLKSEYPTPEELKDFQYEFDIARNLKHINGIIENIAIVDYHNTKAIILEDFGATSIDSIIKSKKINIKSFLVIGIKVAAILEEIHKQKVIHKDIKPQNILLNPDTGEVKLIDFGISSQFTKEIQQTVSPDRLEGTLAYISPEQTGRMNRSIDYRTDFYSLGVTFYEMLTKKLPFESTDPMELVHSHIARIPTPVNQINKEVPEVISNIVSKLLEKTAEKRYQSAYGLRVDLEKCFTMLKENKQIETFEVASSDLSNSFIIPEKIYGREQEIKYLMEVYNSVASGSKQAVFFLGISGIGKSVLINEVHKPMTEKPGYFISGKYDQFKKNIPYTAIIQAFQDLVKQIITESDRTIGLWKSRIMEAVGSNGQVITNVIPSLEMIIGQQPDVQELPSSEAQNRFNSVFQNFIKVFTSKSHPLVIFLDDLQWADTASLNLLEIIMSDVDINSLLFLGAYRNNEVDKTHPIIILKEKLKQSDLDFMDILVKPLEEEAIINLVADTLNLKPQKVQDLGRLIKSKTEGNPFFVIEFLKSLHNENLIFFKNEWKWNINKIQEAGITDNVIELMAGKIQKLPTRTLSVMKTACCIGVKFYLDTLSSAYEKTADETISDLIPAINNGMVIKIDEELKFVHDKVREATYILISDNEQKKMHYKIGKILLDNTEINDNNRVFSIVNQLNLAQTLLLPEEKKALIELNIQAGNKAKLSSAYSAAVSYFRLALNLLSGDYWTENYSLALNLFTNLAEAEFLNRNYSESEELFNLTLKKSNKTLDKIKIYSLQVEFFSTQMKYKEAIETSKQALKEIGLKLPRKANQLSAFPDIIRAKMKINTAAIKGLIDLPILSDPQKKATMNLLMKCFAPAYISDPNLMVVVVMKMILLSLKFGNSYISAISYSTYSFILFAALGDVSGGYEFSKLAINLADKFENKIAQGIANFIFAVTTGHFVLPLKESLEYYRKGQFFSLEAGDFQYLGYNYYNYTYTYLLTGENLATINKEFEKIKNNVYKLKQSQTTNFFNIIYQSLYNLINKTTSPTSLKGDIFNEDDTLKTLLDANDMTGLYFFYTMKTFLCLIFNKGKDSQEIIKQAEKYLSAGLGASGSYLFHFSQAIIYSELYECFTKNEQIKCKKVITNKLAILYRMQKNAPTNYRHKYLLICAELSKLTQKKVKVAFSKNHKGNDVFLLMSPIELYDHAINGARENGFTQEEAIANECAAKYYLSIGAEKAAAAYMQEARYCYEKWGCIPKVQLLDQKYPDLLAGMQLRAGGGNMMAGTLKATTVSTASTSKMSTGPTTSFLDMGTIMKSSQTLASEIEMKNLLTKMIKILIENAGAQKGLLILANDDNKLFIEAEGDVNKENVAVLQSIPLDECSSLSPAIVRYVAKTKESVVLDNATTDSTYANDQYIKEQKPLSVLCTPIINQGRVAAILYLENNLSSAAFTENRIEVLNVLSTQAAISIENARLIEGMKEKERLKQEMEIAERIQTSLVPPAPEHDELDIAVCMEPAEEVGGDYYDVLYDQENKLWFAIGDVTGHGVTPGLIMMMAATSFNTDVIGSKGKTPRDAMITVNQVLTQNVRKRLKETHFMTMSFMKYDEGGRFTYTGAHCDIVVFRKKTGKCDLYETKGIYLGIKADISKVTLDKEFNIDVDDIVVIYTDGVIESRHKDDRNKLMGMDILQDIIIENSNQDANTIMEAIKTAALEWCDYKPDDDITMVVAKRTK